MKNPIRGPRGRRYAVLPLLLALVAGALSPRSAPRPAVPAAPTVAIGSAPAPSLPRGARVFGPLPGATTVRLIVGLAPRRRGALDAFLRERADARSPLYHRTLSPGEYARIFGPTAADEDAVAAYLQARGLRIVRRYRDHLLLDVAGTASRAAAAFGVALVRYRDRQGHIHYANSGRPRLPAALAPLVMTVVGLRDDMRLHHIPIGGDINRPRNVPLPHVRRVAAPPGATRTTRGHGVPLPPATQLTPLRIQAAYDIASLYTSVITGSNGVTTTATITGGGQTVALFELSPFKPEDIAAYDAAFGIAAAPPVDIPVDGGATDSYGDAGAQETALDIELVHAVAPGARVLVYNGPTAKDSANNTTADDLYARIVDDGRAQVLSTSWGQCEDEQQADQPPDLPLLHNLFARAVAEGMTVVAASGDSGANDCMSADGSTPDTTKRAVDYPASDPYVVAVGGTRLALAADGGIASEQGWAGSGGGLSTVFARPAWQMGPGVDNASSNGMRQVPDVALDAGAGYAVWVGGGWLATGGVGTSAATPAWAGILSLGNQLRYAVAAANGAPPLACATPPGLGDIHQELYQLGATPGTTPAFRDITVGSSNGVDTPGPGWDYVTGLGVPDAGALVRALVALPALAPPTTGVCPVPPRTPTPVATSTPPPRATPSAAPATKTPATATRTPATRTPAPTPTKGAKGTGARTGPRLTARVVPGQVVAGGTAQLQLRGAGERGLRVTFEIGYPTRPQHVGATTDKSGNAAARVRVPRGLSGRRILIVRLRATVQERGRTLTAQTSFIVLQPSGVSH